MSPTADAPKPTAASLFASWLARRELGDEADFEEVCRTHPAAAERLRELLLQHQQMEDRLPGPAFFRRTERGAPRPAPGLQPGKVVGDYRLVSFIAKGGMGEVWEAGQISLRRTVAVKFVRPERVTERQLELFAREARAGGRLHHSGIVTVYGYGQSDGLAWIAMELVSGAWTLKDFLDEVARAEEVPQGYDRHVARFVAELAEAMQTAHEAGVIHRDLKPQNVLITHDDHPKVTDFGLARITDESALSQTGDFAGTYFYMSPEQVTARRMGVDHRTDVFSLGIVLYELLALRRPFEGDTSHQVAAQIVTKNPPDIRTIRSRVPRDLAVIAGKALEKDRDKRFQAMKDFAADLRRHLSNEPIHATPPTRIDRAVKWAKRNPGKSSAAAIAAVTFTVIALLSIANVRTNRALTTERANLATANTELAATAQREKTTADLAKTNERLAREETAKVLRLSDVKVLQELEGEADKLWPAHPDKIPPLNSWLDRARALAANLPGHRATLAEMRGRAHPWSEEERARDRASHPRAGELAEKQAELSGLIAQLEQGLQGEVQEKADKRVAELEPETAALRSEVESRRTWSFDAPEDQWQHDVLTGLIGNLEGLVAGLLADDASTADHGWSVPKRLSVAHELEARFGEAGEYTQAWSQVLPVIHAEFQQLGLWRQVDLVPIGQDTQSQLWEFAIPSTGSVPTRDSEGRLATDDSSGVVLVLIVGGEFDFGLSQSSNGIFSEVWPQHGPRKVGPFLIAKSELSNSQWVRMSGYPRPPNQDPFEPVVELSCEEVVSVLGRFGLRLPREDEWEFAARSGTVTPWWSKDFEQRILDWSMSWPSPAEIIEGVGPPFIRKDTTCNPFGLSGIFSGAAEWCQVDESYYIPDDNFAQVVSASRAPMGVARDMGELIFGEPNPAWRSLLPQSVRLPALGVRPARSLVPHVRP